jgi:hypothetical protein
MGRPRKEAAQGHAEDDALEGEGVEGEGIECEWPPGPEAQLPQAEAEAANLGEASGVNRRVSKSKVKDATILPKRTSSGPLPRDLSLQQAADLQDELRQRKEEARRQQRFGVSSTRSNYESAERCWFQKFIEYAEWDLEESRVFVDEQGEIKDSADGP